MDWYDLTEKYHEKTFTHDGRLSALPEDWQRELAAIWRLEADVNNGAYLQFFANWGFESYVYASQGLKKIGALKTAKIIDQCQALIDKFITSNGGSHEQMQNILSNSLIGRAGQILKEEGSILPSSVAERINELSDEFMNYPDDIATLGLNYYQSLVVGDF